MYAFKGRDILSIKDFSAEEILHILDVAEEIMESDVLCGKRIASVFFENSTRTRLSFETAAQRLGAEVMRFNINDGTSVSKGETLHDTLQMLRHFGAECIVIRHPREGAPQWAADILDVPVINAGDGAHEHPTQTFLDLFTIRKHQGRLENLTLALVGDLKYGRTIHSLVQALSLFPGIRILLISPPLLRLPEKLKRLLLERGVSFEEVTRIEDVISDVDVLYMTRIQEERFGDKAEYEAVKHLYKLDLGMLENVKDTLSILHPLPRNKNVLEIDTAVDDTRYAHYFVQAGYGVPVRMALLLLVLGEGELYHSEDSKDERVYFEDHGTSELRKKEGPYLVYEMQQGTIIDHVRDGMGVKVLQYLGLPSHVTYTLGAHLPSQKLGRKDIVKIFDYVLSTEQMSKLGLVAPGATVNIKTVEGLKKGKVILPERIVAIVQCTNPHCISHAQYVEHVPTVFSPVQGHFQCHYCDTVIPKEEIIFR